MLVAKNLACNEEMQVRSLGWECIPLEKNTTHSSILLWVGSYWTTNSWAAVQGLQRGGQDLLTRQTTRYFLTEALCPGDKLHYS